jgi:hypothetical protein
MHFLTPRAHAELGRRSTPLASNRVEYGLLHHDPERSARDMMAGRPRSWRLTGDVLAALDASSDWMTETK